MNDWAKVIAGLSIAALVWFVLPTSSSTPPQSTSAAGWNDLVLCSELVSFDAKKTLHLYRKGTALLVDNSGARPLSEKATWELGNRPGAYDINFDDRSLHYERIAPDEWDS
jgi:hypothetical protein